MDFLKNLFIKFKKVEKDLPENIKKHFQWDKELVKKIQDQNNKKRPSLKQLKYFSLMLNKKEKLLFLIGALIFVLSLSGFILHLYLKLPLVSANGGDYIEGVVGEVENFNPLLSSNNELEQSVNRLVFSGLVKWENNELVPDLAESWELKDNNKKYVFYLRKNIFWHDGKNLTADDIIFTLQTIQNEKVSTPLKQNFKNITFKKIDDYSLEISLSSPLAPFLSLMTFGIIPKHLWEKMPVEQIASSKLNLAPIGSGPFKLKNISRDSDGKIKNIYFEKNNKYFVHAPYLNKIILKLFNNYDEALSSLTTKQIDGLNYIRRVDEIEDIPKLTNFYKIPLSYYTAIFFNEDGSVLSNQNIRQALAFSFDKKEIDKNFNNVVKIDSSIINPLFKSSDIKKYNYSLDAATSALKSGGYKKKNQWFVNNKNKALEINLVCSDNQIYKTLGESFKKNWENFGIKVNLKILDKDAFGEAISKGNYDAVIYSLIEGYDPDPFALWHSSQKDAGLNLSNFKDSRVDFLLEQARSSTDFNLKKKNYEEFQRIISEDVPAIFLYETNLSYFQDKKINGFESNFLAIPADRFANIENWYIFTKRGLKK